jgi:hypothetical protein
LALAYADIADPLPYLLKRNAGRIFVFMTDVRCATCSAEIVPGTNFCRACGAPVEVSAEPSELQTALLDQNTARPTTQRFDARKTSEASDAAAVRTYYPAANQGNAGQVSAPARSRRGVLVVVLVLLALIAAVGLTRVLQRVRTSRTQILVSKQLQYPGAHTVVNVGDAGGGVLQIETDDPLEKVSAWYEAALKPTTTMRATGGVLIMRNDKVTATLASTDRGTTIVVKQAAP